jgi:protease YdgD
MRLAILLLAAALAPDLALTSAAGAEEAAGPSPATVDVTAYPWSAIGKFNNSTGGSCTAVAISPTEVLTAAHCIFNRRTRRFLQARSLHVLFGYERGKYTHHALVDSYALGPGYDPAKESKTIKSDWAVLTLVAPLPANIRPLRPTSGIPTPGTPLMTAGYARGTSHVMTADESCEVLPLAKTSGLIANDCRVAEGASGSPLIVMEGGGASVAGIEVAIGNQAGKDFALAVPVTGIGAALPRQGE